MAASSINALGITMAERPFNPAVPADRRGAPAPAAGRLQPDQADRRGDPGGAPPADRPADDRDPAAADAVRRSGHARARRSRERLDNPELGARVMWVYCDVRDLATGLPPGSRERDAWRTRRSSSRPTTRWRASRWPSCCRATSPAPRRWRSGLTGTTPAVVSTKAKRLLGYQPRHSWREYVNA